MKTKWMTLIAICCMAIACSSNEEPIVDPEKEEVVKPKEEESKKEEPKEEPKTEKKTNEFKPIELTEAEKVIATQNLDFAFRLFKEVDASIEDASEVVISPLSALFALSMLANGAAGETQAEIVKALGFEDSKIADVNAFSQKILKKLPTMDEQSTVGIANSLWMNEGYSALETFENVLKENYDAEVFQYDFSQGPTPINEWCAEKTNNCIPKFLDELNAKMLSALFNALYFKGAWEYPFEAKDTKQGDFTNADGTTAKVDFMCKEATLAYTEQDVYSAMKFGYGNGAFSLTVLLPAEGSTPEAFLKDMDGAALLTCEKSMKYQLVDIKLPKFKLDRKDNLNEALQALGMKKAFSDKEADFSNYSTIPLMVSLVLQANSFSIDEKGVEGAAVTGVMMDGAMGEETSAPKAKTFHVNRPFLFILKENSTNTILFMGKVEKM